MKLFVIAFTLLFTTLSARADIFGQIAKCTRTDNVVPGEPEIVIYIMTSAMDGDYSKPNDGLIVSTSNDDIIAELGSPVLASSVDIVSNGTSYTIPDDGIYGDSLTFTEGAATENIGKNATFSCEMTY